MLPQNRTYVTMPIDCHSLFRALWTADTHHRCKGNLRNVEETRHDIAQSILDNHTPFFIQFFAQFADYNHDLVTRLRDSLIKRTFKTTTQTLVEQFKQAIHQLKTTQNVNSKRYRACVEMYASMISTNEGKSWGGPVEIQAFANLKNKTVVVYEENKNQTMGVVQYHPLHAFPNGITPPSLGPNTIAIVQIPCKYGDCRHYHALLQPPQRR